MVSFTADRVETGFHPYRFAVHLLKGKISGKKPVKPDLSASSRARRHALHAPLFATAPSILFSWMGWMSKPLSFFITFVVNSVHSNQIQ